MTKKVVRISHECQPPPCATIISKQTKGYKRHSTPYGLFITVNMGFILSQKHLCTN